MAPPVEVPVKRLDVLSLRHWRKHVWVAPVEASIRDPEVRVLIEDHRRVERLSFSVVAVIVQASRDCESRRIEIRYARAKNPARSRKTARIYLTETYVPTKITNHLVLRQVADPRLPVIPSVSLHLMCVAHETFLTWPKKIKEKPSVFYKSLEAIVSGSSFPSSSIPHCIDRGKTILYSENSLSPFDTITPDIRPTRFHNETIWLPTWFLN